MARGRPVDPDRADLRESLGPVSDQARLIFRGGKYVLRQRVTDKGNSPTDRWVSRTIDTPEGRKAVEEWIAANYEALKCAAIALPGLQVLLERRLLWYDDRFCVLVELMEKIPVGGKYADTENMEYVDNLPTSAMERLRSLFQQYGSITEFDPDVLADTHTWVDLAD